MSGDFIHFNRPCFAGKELVYIAEAISRGHISGDGHFTQQCRALLEKELGAPAVLLTTSCTHALEMAAILLELRPGDEVIVPSFTFVSTANAFALRGARLVFCDVRPDTLNLDEARLPALVNERTRAIVPVHYAGVGCEMDAILAVANRAGAVVVEDNAHGLFAKFRGRALGTFGALATQSFHETKNFQCGEGGALVINDPRYCSRAEIIREKGTNRAQFFRGQVDKYTWTDIGSSYLPSDVLAAFLYAQLEARKQIQLKRHAIWDLYRARLQDWAQAAGVRLPVVPAHCEHPAHMFYLLLPNLDARQALIAHLKSHGILAVFHYQPLHLSPMGRTFGGRPGQCPVTEDISDRVLRLPLYNDLEEEDQERVIEAVIEFKP
jgi:dTDP-4-amino-4,6-dideoxygalactose transaminase